MSNSPNIDYSKHVSEEDFLSAELQMGIGFHNKDFVALCDATASQFKDYRINTVLDYGAGTGVYAESYRKKGYDVYVYEIWKPHRDYIQQNAPNIKITPNPITTDLMNFIEVAEHMTDNEIIDLFSIIQPKYILFSSTSERTDWDMAWGHINIKEQNDWINMFKRFGYKLLKNCNVPTHYTKLFIRHE